MLIVRAALVSAALCLSAIAPSEVAAGTTSDDASSSFASYTRCEGGRETLYLFGYVQIDRVIVSNSCCREDALPAQEDDDWRAACAEDVTGSISSSSTRGGLHSSAGASPGGLQSNPGG